MWGRSFSQVMVGKRTRPLQCEQIAMHASPSTGAHTAPAREAAAMGAAWEPHRGIVTLTASSQASLSQCVVGVGLNE
eukprot:5834094-Alexandrium_andersonii.AAC.1